MQGPIQYVKASLHLGKGKGQKKGKKKKKPSYTHRDYRGVDGAVKDAEKG